MTRVLVACEDAGGASALAPVVRALHARGDSLRFLLGPVAARTLTSEGIVAREPPIDQERDLASALQLMTRSSADAVLCGSSAFGLRIDARACAAARNIGVPVLAIVDFPSNYRERFTLLGSDTLDALPDRIAVIDERMREDMLQFGFEADRIIVTGPPSFDALLSAVRSSNAPRTPSNEALFLSQPIARFCGTDESSQQFLGYTEATAFAAVLPLVRRAGLVLRVRMHPRENPDERGAYERSFVDGDAFSEAPSLEHAVASARIVLGMNTMALTAAALQGAPALSIQIGLRGSDMLLSNRVGLTTLVTNPDGLERAFADALGAPVQVDALKSRVAALGWRPGATARISDALDALTVRANDS